MNIKELMNKAYNCKGSRIVILDGMKWGTTDERTVMDVRVMYGGNIMLTLDKPVTGATSPLFTVTPNTVFKIQFG